MHKHQKLSLALVNIAGIVAFATLISKLFGLLRQQAIAGSVFSLSSTKYHCLCDTSKSSKYLCLFYFLLKRLKQSRHPYYKIE
ncbi:hypothetical protein [Scytonema sp. PRP1]|uniref:hypothetical protein n=1 Tax=Scytonema sp. PRP1 TaxID=3120513 RepID=UPI00300C844B